MLDGKHIKILEHLCREYDKKPSQTFEFMIDIEKSIYDIHSKNIGYRNGDTYYYLALGYMSKYYKNRKVNDNGN